MQMLTEQESKHLIHYHKTHQHLRSIGDGSDYKAINHCHIASLGVRDILNRVAYDACAEIRLSTGQKVYPEMINLTEWPIGGIQDPHLDTYSSYELNSGPVDPDANPRREWTMILHLNSQFSGGRTYFPDQDYTNQPAEGEAILFQGIYHKHGVEKVRRCPRHTIAMWFSEDYNNIMTDMITDHLDIDHLQLRKRCPK
jgi:hypothetical protein